MDSKKQNIPEPATMLAYRVGIYRKASLMEALSVTSINPWKHIFLHPKETIEWVVENNPEQFYRKLFWTYYASTVFMCVIAYFSLLGGDSKLFNQIVGVCIILSPLISFLSVYCAIYVKGFVINSIAWEFFQQKRPFKLAKETLPWSGCALTTLSIGRYGLTAITHIFFGNQFYLNCALDALLLFYGLFLYANTFRGLYNLSKTQGYIFAGIGAAFGLCSIILRIILVSTGISQGNLYP